MYIYLTADATQGQSPQNIIVMHDMNNKIEIQVMSYYKNAVWNYYKIASIRNVSAQEIKNNSLMTNPFT